MGKYTEKMFKIDGMDLDRKRFMYYIMQDSEGVFVCRSPVKRKQDVNTK